MCRQCFSTVSSFIMSTHLQLFCEQCTLVIIVRMERDGQWTSPGGLCCFMLLIRAGSLVLQYSRRWMTICHLQVHSPTVLRERLSAALSKSVTSSDQGTHWMNDFSMGQAYHSCSCHAPMAFEQIYFCCCRQSRGMSFCSRYFILEFRIYMYFLNLQLFSFSFPWLVFPRRDFAENHVELLNYSTLMTCTKLTVL